jgi:hypothetical protein
MIPPTPVLAFDAPRLEGGGLELRKVVQGARESSGVVGGSGVRAVIDAVAGCGDMWHTGDGLWCLHTSWSY